MQTKFSPSVNIIRDESQVIEYISTPNAEKVALQISNEYKKGIHSFTLIGSYGTGKSSFLWALEKSLTQQGNYLPANLGIQPKAASFLKVVGTYQSITEHFSEQLGVKENDSANRNTLDALYQEYKKNGSLIILIDEFGKFLEYAVKHNPDKELYFLQQLAELVNNPKDNILLITTLHQSFEAYGNQLADSEKQEWKKIKGRFHDITFNEPIEQLLLLAAKKLQDNKPLRGFRGHVFSELSEEFNISKFSSSFKKQIENSLYPLDIISATILTKALQKYGQNERSLFSFLQLETEGMSRMNLPKVYDYLLRNFYNTLQSSTAQSFNHWRLIERGIERVEFELKEEVTAASAIIKTIGLLQIFAPNATINEEFLSSYLKESFSKQEISNALKAIDKRKIIVFARYNMSYKLIEGTDLDFEQAILQAGEEVSELQSLVPLLQEHFEFPVIQAKKASYVTGTPRLFEMKVSDKPIDNYNAIGAYDGAVNLIFNELIDSSSVQKISGKEQKPIVYGLFENTAEIRESLFELLRTKKVLVDNREDIVAKRELENIITARESLLQHQVMDAMYSKKVSWIYNGEVLPEIGNARRFNNLLSRVSDETYPKSPVFNNELANKHKISSSIHGARKNYFSQLTENWKEQDLGFENDKFPPEKTIYITLLKENGMHFPQKQGFELGEPNSKNGFNHLWEASVDFLNSSASERKPLSQLIDILSSKPYKIKQGLIDFWIPTFLFIKRADFALYEDERFVPQLNDAVLYMMTRNPEKYSVKAFEISGIRLTVFNKYRELLEQEEQPKLTNAAFIESIRPFLIFYQNLDEYAKTTQKLDQASLELRKAITNASDPEKTFFEDFPAALGISLDNLAKDEKKLVEFFAQVNGSIEDLKGAYDNLIGRIDLFIRTEILGSKQEFPAYKNQLQKRFKEIKEHRLTPKQKIFLQRLQSSLDDRNSWVASISQAVLGKPLEKITDQEEDILKDRLSKMIQELENFNSIHKVQKSDSEEVIKLDITTSSGLIENNIRIPEKKKGEIDSLVSELKGRLNENKQLKLAVLAQLLKDELNG